MCVTTHLITAVQTLIFIEKKKSKILIYGTLHPSNIQQKRLSLSFPCEMTKKVLFKCVVSISTHASIKQT